MTTGRRRLIVSLGLAAVLGLCSFGGGVHAQEGAPPEAVAQAQAAAAVVNSGDTAWLLASAALVMLMTAPGLALFYGGLVSQKNLLSTLMHSFFLVCLISVQWVLFGYSLAFGPGGLVGGFTDLLVFGGVGQDPLACGTTVPHLAFAVYQRMFAVITPALISGAIAERMSFSAYVALHPALGDPRLRPARALGLGGRRLAPQAPRASTSPAAPSSTSARASRPSSPASCSASGSATGKRGLPAAQHHAHPDRRRRCSGSAGSGSTRAARSGASGLAAQAFVNTNTAAAIDRTGLGPHRVGRTAASPRCSERSRARWPGSWPSRPLRDT